MTDSLFVHHSRLPFARFGAPGCKGFVGGPGAGRFGQLELGDGADGAAFGILAAPLHGQAHAQAALQQAVFGFFGLRRVFMEQAAHIGRGGADGHAQVFAETAAGGRQRPDLRERDLVAAGKAVGLHASQSDDKFVVFQAGGSMLMM